MVIGHITYPLARYFRVHRLKIAIFAHCILLVDSQRRNAQQYQRNLYIAEKFIYWATILSLTIRVYLYSPFSLCSGMMRRLLCCLQNLRNSEKIRTY